MMGNKDKSEKQILEDIKAELPEELKNNTIVVNIDSEKAVLHQVREELAKKQMHIVIANALTAVQVRDGIVDGSLTRDEAKDYIRHRLFDIGVPEDEVSRIENSEPHSEGCTCNEVDLLTNGLAVVNDYDQDVAAINYEPSVGLVKLGAFRSIQQILGVGDVCEIDNLATVGIVKYLLDEFLLSGGDMNEIYRRVALDLDLPVEAFED